MTCRATGRDRCVRARHGPAGIEQSLLLSSGLVSQTPTLSLLCLGTRGTLLCGRMPKGNGIVMPTGRLFDITRPEQSSSPGAGGV